jgi:hypothetical protein
MGEEEPVDVGAASAGPPRQSDLARALDLARARDRDRVRLSHATTLVAELRRVIADLADREAPDSASPPPPEFADATYRKTQGLATEIRAIHADTCDGLAGRGADLLITRLAATCWRGLPLQSISELLNDYEAADLRSADLTQVVSLDGIRWTDKTRWPDGWAAKIDRRSVEVGPGVREIREGIGMPRPT